MLTYPAFLAICGAAFIAAERLWPRNPAQRVLRKGLAMDLGLLVFHSEIGGWLAAMALAKMVPAAVFAPYRWGGLEAMPGWAELLALWAAKDFLQWWVHNALHRVPLLWRIHRLHHTSEELDWLSNWRFHPLETLAYQTALYAPALLLGVRPGTALLCAFLSTAVSHFAHSNLRLRLGPLRYVLNSPEFHAWHHAHPEAGPRDRNFGVSFAIWDWMFGTAHCPGKDPARLGVER